MSPVRGVREIGCEVCGKPVPAQRSTRRYCGGDACRQKAKRDRARERELGISRDPAVVKLCNWCGEPTGDPALVRVIPRGLYCADCLNHRYLPRVPVEERRAQAGDTIALGLVPCTRCGGPVQEDMAPARGWPARFVAATPGVFDGEYLVPDLRPPRRKYCNPECRKEARNRRRRAYRVAERSQELAYRVASSPGVVTVALPGPPSQEAAQRLAKLLRRPGRNRVVVSWPAPADPDAGDFDGPPDEVAVFDASALTAADAWLIQVALSDVKVR